MSYYASDEYYNKSTAAYYTTSTSSNHAVTIVGWDDNFSRNNFNASCRPASDGAWIVKNSWGTWWGDDGLFYLSYEDCSLDDVASYEMGNINNYSAIYQYDASMGMSAPGDGYVYYKGLNQLYNATNANVFTTKNSDSLTAVAFSTYNADVDYKITIFTGVKDDSSSGTVVHTQSGTATYSGFHTVKLNKAIPLTKGSKFAVAISFIGSEVHFYDNNSTCYGLSYFASTTTPGASTSWEDNEDRYDRSACIKAYTSPSPVKPKNVKATPGDGRVTVTWDKLAGATNYGVFYMVDGKVISAGTTTATSKAVTNLAAGKKHAFLVRAMVNGVWTSYTAADWVFATPIGVRVKNVNAAAGDGQVTLTWDELAGATNYGVFLTVDGKGKAVCSTTENSRVVTGLTNGKKYAFLVRAMVNGTWTEYTNADWVFITLNA